MRIPFRRRRILDPLDDGSGAVMEWLIPYVGGARNDEDALVEHFRRLSRLNPALIFALMNSRLGSLAVGRVRVKGGRINIDSLEAFDDAVEATPGALPADQYEREMLGHSPLQLRVFRRLRAD